MVQSKGYLMVGMAFEGPSRSPERWRSQGSIFTNDEQGSIRIKHVDAGFIFESKKAAEAHGLELCKKWIDENLKPSDDM